MFRAVQDSITTNEPMDGAANPISAILRAIDGASQLAAAGECQGIMAAFALRMAGARAAVRDPLQLGATLRAIKQERRAALATARRKHRDDKAADKSAALLTGTTGRQRPRDCRS